MTTTALNMQDYLNDLATLPVKAWLAGPPGSGKTGSLEALLRHGLTVRLLSIDGNIRPLAQQVALKCPQAIERLDAVRISQETELDSFGRRSEPTGSHAIDEIESALYRWPGKEPADTALWTAKHEVLVIDNLTNVSSAAVTQVRRLNNKLGGKPMDFSLWGIAHDRILQFYENLASDRFRCNVLCLCHIDYTEVSGATNSGAPLTFLRGFPSTIGKSLGAKIFGTFDTALLYESRPDDEGRFIITQPTRGVDVKVPVPSDLIGKELSVVDGLGEIFAAMRGEKYTHFQKKEDKKKL